MHPSRLARRIAFCAFTLLPPLIGQHAIGEWVGERKPARFETAVAFDMRIGTTTVFEVVANAFGVKTFLLMPDSTGSMWLDYGQGPTAKNAACTGAVDQLGHAPCAALLEWTRDGDRFVGTLTLTSDRGAITKAVQRVEAKEVRWAIQLRTSGLVQHPDPSETERIAGFVRLWSEVKYNFAFFDHVPGLDWDQVLVDWLPRVQAAKTAAAYYRELERCMALLKDGHSDVSGPSDWPTAAPPIAVRELERRIVVSGIAAPSALDDATARRELEAAGLQLGDELLAIDGEPVEQVLKERIHPYVCASTPQHRALVSCPRLLRGEAGTRVRLTVRTGEHAPRDVTLTRDYVRAPEKKVRHDNGVVADGIVYVELSSFGNMSAAEAFEALLPTIRGKKGLILDVRRNGGGSTSVGARILSWLTDEPLQGSRWRTRAYKPAFRAWGRPEEWHEGTHDDIEPKPEPWLGPVVVLTGPATFSAAEDFLVVLKASRRARLVGEATGGSTGQPLVVRGLPAGGTARICTKRDTFPDGSDFVGIGVLPDVRVRPTIVDHVAGRDTVFLRGLEELRGMIE